ncbi:DNA end-binding protein Ku [Panacagrimonas perspica]|uniref:Non-homologous end joining protein Ku n=1 Tax=Panacagrimonas perspica TaxID=381431 RepID=A0A4R7P3E3_9GAMM|nr:Ku protein [Panacagrimonas perspica]TDU28275.1 DNA end-binding protein Ku [Panacagrimonas perspica]THD04312.1 Ku protein [Panacagrimonas perspica]
MARPIWTGAISFGLLNIPVQLMPAERRIDLRFHMLDSRNQKRVRYERVNADTGEEVPWKDVVKAFEYSKGNYVVLEEEDIRNAAPESKESVDIEAFVDPEELGPMYFDRPYYLVPTRKSEKGYVLLRETLRDLKKAGLARVVIRTREHLALVLPDEEALVLHLLRFPQELVDRDEYSFPGKSDRSYKIAPREREMARQLVSSMSAPFKPSDYRDEFRDRLSKVIQARVKAKGKGKKRVEPVTDAHDEHQESGKVVDFMALLKKSIADNKRTPAATKKAGAKAKKTAVARRHPAPARKAKARAR